ncbi:putative glutathione-s-transferase theta, gst, partial [Corchorus olitorius]
MIGVLVAATGVKSITLSNNRGTVDMRDILVVLKRLYLISGCSILTGSAFNFLNIKHSYYSGERVKMTLWDPKLMDLSITDVIRLGYKPVLVLGGIFIKDGQ